MVIVVIVVMVVIVVIVVMVVIVVLTNSKLTTTVTMGIQVRHKLEETYSCKAGQDCVITKELRNRCQFCRLQKCLQSGMNREAVQEGEEKVALGGSRIKQEQELKGLNIGEEEIADQEQEEQDYLEAVLLSLEQVRSQMEAIDDSRRWIFICRDSNFIELFLRTILNLRRTTEWPTAVKDLHRGALTEWAR